MEHQREFGFRVAGLNFLANTLSSDWREWRMNCVKDDRLQHLFMTKKGFLIMVVRYSLLWIIEDNFQIQAPVGLYSERLIIEDILRFRFEGLLHGGTYTRRGLFLEFYGRFRLRLQSVYMEAKSEWFSPILTKSSFLFINEFNLFTPKADFLFLTLKSWFYSCVQSVNIVDIHFHSLWQAHTTKTKKPYCRFHC